MSEHDELLAMLLEQGGRLCCDHIDSALHEAVERGERPDALISAFDDFGLMDAIGAEDMGLLPPGNLGPIAAMLGEHAVPLPVGETIVARWLLNTTGMDVPAGFIGLVDLGSGSGIGAGIGTISQAGLLTHCLAHRGDDLLLYAVPGELSAIGSIARQGLAAIDLNRLSPLARVRWPEEVPSLLELGALLRASFIAGALARVLAMSVDYANTRKQFGRPIGKFQAVQQLVARLAGEAAAVRAVADTAWTAVERGVPASWPAIAKLRAGEGARLGAALAHQVHGAIGFTAEHVLHHHTRRLWDWRLQFGGDAYWARRLGSAARTAPGGIWNFIVGPSATAACSELAVESIA